MHFNNYSNYLPTWQSWLQPTTQPQLSSSVPDLDKAASDILDLQWLGRKDAIAHCLDLLKPTINQTDVNGIPNWYAFLDRYVELAIQKYIQPEQTVIEQVYGWAMDKNYEGPDGRLLLEKWYLGNSFFHRSSFFYRFDSLLKNNDIDVLLSLFNRGKIPIFGRLSLNSLIQQKPEFGLILQQQGLYSTDVGLYLSQIDSEMEEFQTRLSGKSILYAKPLDASIQNLLAKVKPLWPCKAAHLEKEVEEKSAQFGFHQRRIAAEKFIEDHKTDKPRLTLQSRGDKQIVTDPCLRLDVVGLLFERQEYDKIGHYLQLTSHALDATMGVHRPLKIFILDKALELTELLNPNIETGSNTQLMTPHLIESLGILIRDLDDASELSAEERKEMLSVLTKLERSLATMNALFSLSITDLAEAIQSLLIDKNVDYPILIPASSAQHAMLAAIEKNADGSYKLSLFNSGEGLHLHPRKPLASKEIYQTYLSYDLNPASWIEDCRRLRSFIIDVNSGRTVQEVYQTFFTFAGRGDHVPPSKKAEDYEQCQLSGTCSGQSLMAFIRYYMMQQKGNKFHCLGAYKKWKARAFIALSAERMPHANPEWFRPLKYKMKKYTLDLQLATKCVDSDAFLEILDTMKEAFAKNADGEINPDVERAIDAGRITNLNTTHQRFAFVRGALKYIETLGYDKVHAKNVLCGTAVKSPLYAYVKFRKQAQKIRRKAAIDHIEKLHANQDQAKLAEALFGLVGRVPSLRTDIIAWINEKRQIDGRFLLTIRQIQSGASALSILRHYFPQYTYL